MALDLTPHRPVLAAGAVVWRESARGGLEICLVHRPRYDDWSLPKGKLDAGEHVLAAAVREVAEETGHHVALGRPLPAQRYEAEGRPKIVRYWAARADDGAASRSPDAEVDDVVFLPVAAATQRLTHPRDADVVGAFVSGPAHTTPLLVLRHSKAVARKSWPGTDFSRPLSASGHEHANRLAAQLAALGTQRVVTSDAVRCVDTVRPFAASHRVTIEMEPLLSEEGFAAARPRDVARVIDSLIGGGPAAVCSHRPVLPTLIGATGAEPGKPLPPGGFVVIHHHGRHVVDTERHDPS
ncbi:MAG: NUDIX hydrolase [Jiangellaceae bacterium]